MNKTLYTMLIGLIGFYGLLFASLLLRAGAGYFRARQPELPKLEKDANTLTRVRSNRAWTSAVWREKIEQEVQMIEQAATAQQPAKAL